jgi:hypothetical protein
MLTVRYEHLGWTKTMTKTLIHMLSCAVTGSLAELCSTPLLQPAKTLNGSWQFGKITQGTLWEEILHSSYATANINNAEKIHMARTATLRRLSRICVYKGIWFTFAKNTPDYSRHHCMKRSVPITTKHICIRISKIQNSRHSINITQDVPLNIST